MLVLNFRVYSDNPKNNKPGTLEPFDRMPEKKHWVREGHLVLFRRAFFVRFEPWRPNFAVCAPTDRWGPADG